MRNVSIQFAKKKNVRQDKNPSGTVGRTPQRPVGGTGESIGMFGESLLGLAFNFTVCRCQPLSSQWLSLVQRFCKRCAMGFFGKASGHTSTNGMLCGTSRGSAGRTASSFSTSSRRSPLLLQRHCSFIPFSCGHAQGVCFDSLAPDESRR